MYNRKTIEATRQAITKWEKICYEGGEDKHCSLCNLFGYRYKAEIDEEGCWGCPIFEFTGKDCMELPDYLRWLNLFSGSSPKTVLDLESFNTALAELGFIKKIFIKTLLLWDHQEE